MPPSATLEYLFVFLIQLTYLCPAGLPGLALGVKSLPKTQVSLALIGLAHSVLSELSYLTNQKPHTK